MYKGKRYALKQKRYRNFFIFYIIIVIFVFSNYTFSKYTKTVTSESTPISVAKFNVKVNEQIIGVNNEFNLTLSPSNEEDKINTKDNKMVPTSERRFDIVIDPTGTEVALEYEFQFNVKDANIIVTKYSLDNGKTFKTDVENNVVKGDILLKDNKEGFTDKEKVTLSVYLKWDDSQDIYNPTFTDTNVTVACIINQKIN